MNFPLFQRVSSDPAKLKRPGGRPPAEDCIPEVLQICRGEDFLKQTDVIKMMEENGHSQSTVKRQIAKAVKEGQLERKSSPGKPSVIRKSQEIIYVPGE